MKTLTFFAIAIAIASAAFAADFEAALSLPKRTENKVFRSSVKANWLPSVTSGDWNFLFDVEVQFAATKTRNAATARMVRGAKKRGDMSVRGGKKVTSSNDPSMCVQLVNFTLS